MVAPIGNSANKLSFSTTSSTTSANFKNPLPTMSSGMNIGMDIQSGPAPTTNSEVRGRNPLPSANSSRDPSMVSFGRSTPYHDRMDIDPDGFPPNDEVTNERLELLYETEQEKELRTGKATNQQDTMRPLDTNNEATPSHVQHEDDDVINIQLPYDPQAPTEPELWSGSFHPIFLHGSIEHFASDTKNIKVTLNFLAKYIQGKQVNGGKVNNLSNFDGMGDAIWNFISSVYAAKWDALHTDQKTNTLRSKISAKFTPRSPLSNGNTKKDIPKSTPVTINKAPPLSPLPAKTKKEINVISKYFHPKKLSVENNRQPSKEQSGKSYAQASKSSASTSDVLKIKETFPALNAHKIDQVNNIVNSQSKQKPRINMTTKGPSRKHIIIPMSGDNVSSFLKNSSLNVANMNRQLRNAKSDVLVDYIRSDNTSIIVITNKVAQQSDLSIIDQYMKNTSDINALQVEDSRLPKSKSYLKIIGIPYYPQTNSQDKLTASDVKTILKQNHIFDNITLASRPRVIKVSPKSDMAIVWIDIWDVQSGQSAKMLINRCFNVGNYIATIRGANMNSGVPQCKNCWKWGHSTFSCRIQGAKCIKCNGPHKSEHHREFGWCCKANSKTNPPRLETKKGELCPHEFKCSNCKGDHQANSNHCPFWRHRFNREWHVKKYTEICENRSKSIRSKVNGRSNQ